MGREKVAIKNKIKQTNKDTNKNHPETEWPKMHKKQNNVLSPKSRE